MTLFGYCVNALPGSGETYQQAYDRQVGVYGPPQMVRWFDSGAAATGAWNPANTNLRWLLAKPEPVFPTFKCAPALISNGSQDTKLRTHIAQLRRGADILGYWHEREDEVLGGVYTAAAFQAADLRIRALIDEVNPGLDFAAVMMEYSVRPHRASERPVSDYFLPSAHTQLWFDVYSGYAEGSGYVLGADEQIGVLEDLAAAYGVQWGIAEFGSGARPAGRPQFPTRAEWLRTRTDRLLSSRRPPLGVLYFAKGGSVLDADPDAAAVMKGLG